jgi:hypothetical protein
MFHHTTVITAPAVTLERLETAVRERYCRPLYDPADDGGSHVFEVLIGCNAGNSGWVADAGRNTVLQELLLQEFPGVANAELRTKESLGEPALILRFQINAAGQKELFRRHIAETPSFVSSLFPIVDSASECAVLLEGVTLPPPHPKVASRWIVYANLRLVDRSNGTTLDAGEFALCYFFAVGDDGSATEFQRNKRPFDEIAWNFRHSIRQWLGRDVPQSLQKCCREGRLKIWDVFEFEEE